MKETTKARNDVFDLDTLLHPARAFAHPMDVVRDPDLTLNESAQFWLVGRQTLVPSKQLRSCE